MLKAKVRASSFKGVLAMLALCLLPLLLNASQLSTHLVRNDLVNLEASKLIDTMGQELQKKTGLHAYMIATHEHFPERFNLVEYSKRYEAKLKKPYVLFIFAPYATITSKSEERGRIGIIPSSEEVRKLYDYDKVRDAAIKVVAAKDSNSDEAKFNVGIVQAYSELADELAQAKGIKLDTTIPDEMGTVLFILRVLIYSGALIVLWIFILRPQWLKIKNRQTHE
ncbi:membrane protein [hydrothermal vent metagenome]|uniref:Membrane protein n=1 Tax=hydrothermal vent metagenome TaxID=652676 RepID=A0A1W1BLY5_9ZZZZ